MRGRALHSSGFVSSFSKASYFTPDNNLFERCLDHLLKNVLPTLLIVLCTSVIAMYLGGLIEHAKQAHNPAVNVISAGAKAKLH